MRALIEAGRRLEEVRFASRKTLRAVADEVGIHFTYLSKIENGKDRPSQDLVRRLDSTLGAKGELVEVFGGLPCSRCGRSDEVRDAAERLFAPDLDAQRKRYTIASDEPDFLLLRDAIIRSYR